MSWKCDECDYENEYSDIVKYTECQCCGEPASVEKIREAQRELNNYHRKLELIAREKELMRKRMLLQQRAARVNKAIIWVIKAMSVATVVFMFATLISVAALMNSNNKSLSAWKKQMNYNTKTLNVLMYPDTMKKNLDELNVSTNMTETLRFGCGFIGSQLTEQLTAVTGNIITIGDKSSRNVSKNSDMIGKQISNQWNNKRKNDQQLLFSLKDASHSVEDNTRVMGRKLVTFLSNLKENWSVFFDSVKNKARKLIIRFSRKADKTNG